MLGQLRYTVRSRRCLRRRRLADTVLDRYPFNLLKMGSDVQSVILRDFWRSGPFFLLQAHCQVLRLFEFAVKLFQNNLDLLYCVLDIRILSEIYCLHDGFLVLLSDWLARLNLHVGISRESKIGSSLFHLGGYLCRLSLECSWQFKICISQVVGDLFLKHSPCRCPVDGSLSYRQY